MKRSSIGVAIAGGLLGMASLVIVEGRMGDDLDPVSPPHSAPTTSTTTPVATPYNPCDSEDEVRVVIEQDAYDWPAGTQACVHRDFLRFP